MSASKSYRSTPLVFASLVLGVLVAALPYGSNTPFAWMVLCLFVLVLSIVFSLVSFRQPVPFAVRMALAPGVLFLLCTAWGWAQTFPGVSTGLAHPLWSFVPDAALRISADPGQGRQAVMRLLCYGVIFVMSVWACTASRTAKLTLYTIALFSTALAVFGILAAATGQNAILGDAAKRVVSASFVNRNNYATYAVFGALANFAGFLHAMGDRDANLRAQLEGFFKGAWVFCIGFIICVGAVSLSQSRAGGIAGLVGIAVFLLAWSRRGRAWDPVMLISVGAFLLFVALTSATGLVERFISVDDTEGRFAVYPAVVEAILDRPLLGHGLGAFHDVFRAYVPVEAASGEWVRAHNTFLEIVFALGIPMAVVFFAALGAILWRIRQGTLHRRRNRVFSCFALGCFAAAGFHSLFDFSLQIPAVAALFALIAGLGFAQSYSSTLSDEAPDN